jgi:protein-tyrosine sulfotransferase
MLDIDKINNTPFFFIVARGRSGTTMLQTILDSNSNTIIPLESRLIIHLKRKYLSVKKWNAELLDSFIIDLYHDTKFERYWNVDREKLKASFNAIPHDRITFQLLCKIVYLSYPSPFNKKEILLIGDKNPTYSIFTKELIEVFPDAKFIHLLRDYRDNIVSNVKIFKAEKIAVAAQGWMAYNKHIEKEKLKHSKQFITARYEDIVENPKENVLAICKFLGIEFNEKMLHFDKVIKEKAQNEYKKYDKEIAYSHPNIVDPINTKNVNKWKNELTENQIEIIEYIAGEYGEKHGYNLSLPKTYNASIKLKAYSACLRQNFNLMIIKNYYKLPMWIRNMSRSISKFLFQWFNYTNYFTNADFRFKENTNK